MISDQAQRSEALDPSRSFIVQAPAGSGKTGLLVQRCLRLLSTVEKPESVVAVTFTRKAAGEMRERIHDALVDADRPAAEVDEHTLLTRSLALKVLEQDRRHGWDLLRDSSRLHLETIDSLCALLARQMPAVSGFAGSIDVIEDATELYRIAAADTLRRLAEGSEELRSLLGRLGLYFDSDFNGLAEQIVRMLAQRDQWEFSHDMLSSPDAVDFSLLLGAARMVLEDTFKQRGVVDFSAITEAAIRVLGSPEQPSDVLYGLDYRIQHLLVDEFQDTSLAQYKLINALTSQWSEGDGHTLFLVGDPMQSIYRFRGAEVSLFLKTWNERRLQSVRLQGLSLEVNFRSTPQILTWIDQQFSAMPVDGEREVEFRTVEAARTDTGPLPAWRALVGDSGEAEAAAVAELVQEARGRGSVALLVRSRNHLAKILPTLRQSEIEYEAVEIDELGGRQHILDLLSLTRAVLHVADRTAWLACLRAPWCGLSLTDFAAFAENERDRTIFELLNDPVKLAVLAPDSRLAAVRTGEILSAAVAQAGRVPLATLVEQTWLLLGGPAVLRAAYEADDVRTFLHLLAALDDGGTIRDFSQLSQRLSTLFAKGAPAPNAVQVMTVFKAKGLEFDTVILPKLEGMTQSQERDLLIWDETIQADGSAMLAVAAQPRRGEKAAAYDAIRASQKAKNEQELKRLLYVACTRAKNALYLIGNAKLKTKDHTLEQPRSGSFLRLLWPAAQAEFQSALRRSSLQLGFDFAAAGPVLAPEPATVLRRLPAGWQLPRFSRWIDWHPPFRETTPSIQRVTYEWVSDTGRHVGTVVHEILKLAANASPRWKPDAVAELTPTIRSELLRLGVSRAEEAKATERVQRAVRNTLESKRGQWILAPHRDARSEWPLGGKLGDQLISGTVDRIFRDEEERLWIIDFKTSEHEGGRIEQFLEEEERRYRPQLESYGALLSRLADGPIWLALYFPLLDAWREWAYPERAVLTAT